MDGAGSRNNMLGMGGGMGAGGINQNRQLRALINQNQQQVRRTLLGA
jgi:hypothetical protein